MLFSKTRTLLKMKQKMSDKNADSPQLLLVASFLFRFMNLDFLFTCGKELKRIREVDQFNFIQVTVTLTKKLRVTEKEIL